MRMAARALFGLVAAVLLSAALPETFEQKSPEPYPGSLAGKFLVAAPALVDPNFVHSVVLIVQHDARGAFGLIINRPVREISAPELEKALMGDDGDASPPGNVKVLLHNGGPVARNRGFVVHSSEYHGQRTIAVGDGVSVSTSRDVLQAITRGEGPKESLVMLGSAGWGPGQLDGEVGERWWVVAPLDHEIVFDPAADTKWRRAYGRRELDL